MRALVIVISLVIYTTCGFSDSPTAIPDNEAAKHVGEAVAVEGLVAQVTVRPNGIIFLNFGSRYPQHVFTVQIKPPCVVPDAASLEGKSVRVTGTITTYADKPQLILQSADQLSVLEATTPVASQPQPRAPQFQSSAVTASTGAATSKDVAMFSGPLIGMQPGRAFTFQVDFDDQELKMLKKSGESKIQQATVTLLVPEKFDPSRSWPLFAIYSTSDGDGLNTKRMPMYSAALLRAGYVGIAADGPEKVTREVAELHWTFLHAGLRVLGSQWPASTNWPMALGGNSGGAKRAGVQATMWAANGRTILGVFMGGCNSDTITPAAHYFHPPSTFKRTPLFLSSGKSDTVATPLMMRSVATKLNVGGFKTVRLEPFDGGHNISPDEVEKALRWFLDPARKP